MNHRERRLNRIHSPLWPSGQMRWERIKMWVIGILLAVVLTALQTTLLARIPLLIFPPASPSLTLLITLAVGFLLGEREGAVMGLISGFLAEAAAGEGLMLLPFLYTLCGYLVGRLSKDRLAHNLPSFMVWVLIGSVWEQLLRYARAAVAVNTLPPAAMLGQDLLPHLILTVLCAPLVYVMVKLLMKIFVRI